MVMGRISGTVIGTIEAGEAIGTAEATEDGTGNRERSRPGEMR
jgi:hypothetical protein